MQAQSASIKEQGCGPFYSVVSLCLIIIILVNTCEFVRYSLALYSHAFYNYCYYSIHDYALAFSRESVQKRVADTYSRIHQARDSDFLTATP